ncbi:MAG: hypothetical protein CMK89_01560 [Pseudomonadales bacterium]|nr:hypothetical protein [Pseudomonadales bacterium]
MAADSTPSTLQVQQAESTRPDTIAIPSAPGQARKTDLVNGKALIKAVELKGHSLFPEYGVTQQYLSLKLSAAYDKMDPWMTISDMHSLADAMTLAYHEKGLTFNQVFIVPNEIRGNTLIMNVLPGRITEIHLKNNKLYTEEQIKEPFLDLLGTVVYEPAIKDAMKRANMIQGLKVFGFFSMGKHPGQVRLNLHVVSEKKNQFTIRADNYGVNDTGVYRLIGQYSQNNITGHGDILSATLVSTNEFGNLSGVVGYKRPVTIGQSFAGASLYRNQFEIVGDFEAIGLNGHLDAISGFYQLGLFKEDNAIASFYTDIAFKNSVIDSDEFADIFSETVRYGTLDFLFNAAVIPSAGTSKQAIELGLVLGSIFTSDDDEIDDPITIAKLRYLYQRRWLAGNPAEQVTSLDFKVNYSPGVLPSSERTVMTGPYGVRAYEPALFSADSVYSISMQHSLVFLSMYDEMKLLPFGFIDYAYGEQNSNETNHGSFMGAGLGFDLIFRSSLNARVTLGVPISENLTQELAEEPDGLIIYGNISYAF